MPIIKSAKKALRQSKKRRTDNIKKKGAFKRTEKKIKKLLEAEKREDALKLIPMAYKTIDKAAKTNVLKKNTASRRKARIMKMFKIQANA